MICKVSVVLVREAVYSPSSPSPLQLYIQESDPEITVKSAGVDKASLEINEPDIASILNYQQIILLIRHLVQDS